MDTTQYTLQLLLWCLARYPHAQERLRREIRDVVGEAPLTADALAKMHYLRAVLREQHRLHYTVALGLRECLDEDVPISNGLMLPKGAFVFFFGGILPMDPAYVRGDPTLFLPERWLNRAGEFDRVKGGGASAHELDNGERDAPAAAASAVPAEGERLAVVSNYRDLNNGPGAREVEVVAPSRKIKHVLMENPFAVGPRQCIGGRLATTELRCAVVELVRRYQLTNTNTKSRDEEVSMRAPTPDPKIKFERL